MNYLIITFSLLLFHLSCCGQEVLLIDGIETDYHNVPRKSRTLLTIQNSRFVSDAGSGYILEAGDDSYVVSRCNNLDGAKIIGNKFIWTGYDQYPKSTLHGLMVGYNINYTIKHNYFDRLRYTSVFKAGIEDEMAWTSGAHSYNIHKDTKALTIKGIDGVRIYNNTFYSSGYSPLYHISLEENTGGEPDHPATNIIIKNNIFYQKDNFPAIRLRQSSCLEGLQCDYNVYYCENTFNNEPTFSIGGKSYNWNEWRELGFDTHSVVINPMFKDTENFVPSERLDYGVDLGEEHNTGLSTTATWEVGKYPATTVQGENWQVGAVLYKTNTAVNDVESISRYVEVVPNPNDGIFHLNIEQPLLHQNHQVNIVSMEGKILFEKFIPKGNMTTLFTLPSLQPGYYLVKSRTSGFAKKFLKQ
ncbi:T9SS type A sorting domain-containing protein [Labilibacter sediminis]|nr:T9SS type A sorting domain-containing protein [Labilibacter sediminis]